MGQVTPANLPNDYEAQEDPTIQSESNPLTDSKTGGLWDAPVAQSSKSSKPAKISRSSLRKSKAGVSSAASGMVEIGSAELKGLASLKNSRPQTIGQNKKKPGFSRNLVIPGGPAGGVGAIVPRFVETAEHGTRRKIAKMKAEQHIFSS